MTDITEFLTARYDERWFAAEAADRTGHWQDRAWPESCGIRGVAEEHILSQSPKAVLADIAAKRAILEDYLIVWAQNRIEARTGDGLSASAYDLVAKSLHIVLRRFAAAFEHHPDFDPAWRVDG